VPEHRVIRPQLGTALTLGGGREQVGDMERERPALVVVSVAANAGMAVPSSPSVTTL